QKLTALLYPDFDTSALPRLSERIKIDLRTGDVANFNHQSDGRVSVLMAKSVYMSKEDGRYLDQLRFESELRRLFGDPIESIPFSEVAHAMIKAGLQLPY